MGIEPAVQSLGQLWDFSAQLLLSHVGHHRGVGLTGEQRLQHRPRRLAVEVGSDRGQFDPGVFEEFLQPLDLAGAFPRHRGAGARQISQLSDRFRWDERPTDQTMGTELGQPGRVSNVGLAAGQVLHVTRVDQHHLHPGQVLE